MQGESLATSKEMLPFDRFFIGEKSLSGGKPVQGNIRFGTEVIFLPSNEVELEEWMLAAKNLLEMLPEGTYNNSERIIQVLSHHRLFFLKRLHEDINAIGSEEFLLWLIEQLDSWTRAANWAKIETAETNKANWILNNEAMYKRGLRELIERLVQLRAHSQQKRKASSEGAESLVSRTLIHSQEIVRISMQISLVRYYKDDQIDFHIKDFSVLRLNDLLLNDEAKLSEENIEFIFKSAREIADNQYYYEITNSEMFKDVESFQRRLLSHRKAITDTSYYVNALEDNTWDILNDAMKKELGFTLTDAIAILALVARIGDQSPGTARCDFVEVCKNISKDRSLSVDKVARIISGWSVYARNIQYLPDDLRHRPRLLTRPLVISEICYGRPYLLIPDCIDQSATVALELIRRWRDDLEPREWNYQQKGLVFKALEKCDKILNDLLEKKTAKVLFDQGFYGHGIKKKFKTKNICNPTGEIDYLGINPISRLILIVENKNLFGSTDFFGHRKDRDLFNGTNSIKLLQKHSWLKENVNELASWLFREYSLEFVAGTWKIVPVFITNYECLLRKTDSNIPVVSLAGIVDFLKQSEPENNYYCSLVDIQ